MFPAHEQTTLETKHKVVVPSARRVPWPPSSLPRQTFRHAAHRHNTEKIENCLSSQQDPSHNQVLPKKRIKTSKKKEEEEENSKFLLLIYSCKTKAEPKNLLKTKKTLDVRDLSNCKQTTRGFFFFFLLLLLLLLLRKLEKRIRMWKPKKAYTKGKFFPPTKSKEKKKGYKALSENPKRGKQKIFFSWKEK